MILSGGRGNYAGSGTMGNIDMTVFSVVEMRTDTSQFIPPEPASRIRA
jgi:hypothetical protein